MLRGLRRRMDIICPRFLPACSAAPLVAPAAQIDHIRCRDGKGSGGNRFRSPATIFCPAASASTRRYRRYPPHKWMVEEPVHHGPLHRQRVCAAPPKRAPATVVVPATAGTQREAIMAKTKVRGIAGARRAKSRNDRNGCQPLAGMEFRKRALPPSEGSSNFMTPALRRHKAYSWRLTPVPCSAHKN